MAMTIPKATSGAGDGTTTDQFPSGTWGFGPISIQWSLKNDDSVDIKVSILGLDIDDLTGTVSATQASLSDQLNVLGIVKGSLTLTPKYSQGPGVDGLWVSGQVAALGWDSGQLNHRIIPW